MNSLTLCPLKERFYLAPRLAVLHAETWAHLYPVWNAADALREFAAEKDNNGLSATLLAMNKDTFLGSISVCFDDLPGETTLNPWVASFYVLPEHRGRGVGAFLLQGAHELLERHQVPCAYLFTEHTQGYFQRFGWSLLRPGHAHGHPVEIMTRSAPWRGEP